MRLRSDLAVNSLEEQKAAKGGRRRLGAVAAGKVPRRTSSWWLANLTGIATLKWMKPTKLIVAGLVLCVGVAIYEMRGPAGRSQPATAKPGSPPAKQDGPATLVPPASSPVKIFRPAPAPAALPAVVQTISGRPSAENSASARARQAEKHRRYDALFQHLGLTAGEADQFVELLIEQDDARADLQAAVKDQNLRGDSAEVAALRTSLYAPIVRGLRDLVGKDGYDAYATYEKTSYYREAFVGPMLSEFTAAAAPLSDAQLFQLTDVIAASDHPYQRAPTDVGNESSIDWTMVVSKASAFLTPAQLTVIRVRAGRPPSG